MGLIARLSLLAALLVPGLSQASSATIETQYLIASDATGKLSDERLEELANHAQAATERILAYWLADSAVDRYGKIRVVFDEPRRRNYYASVFYWDREHDRRVRVVRVFGTERPPQQMVHKLTSAIFPHSDKLIRNMMGVSTEEQFGNPLTFPGCGFSSDDWARAFLKTKSLVPLNQLGPGHESWGMKVAGDGIPFVLDRAQQSKAYAEAGSFGSYLILTYGINAMKRFYALSAHERRPWQEVFGVAMEELEANWIKMLQRDGKTRDENGSTLSAMFENNPNTACLQAQALVTGKQ